MTTLTTDEAAFLNAIRANPADDVTRLVLADWLDEHGRGAQAELVRVQCELAKQPRRIVLDQDGDGKGILLPRRGGPDYYELPWETAYHYGLKVGDRVDVLRRKREKLTWLRGLRVVRLSSEDEEIDCILCRDSQSGPDPVAHLRARETALIAELAPRCPVCEGKGKVPARTGAGPHHYWDTCPHCHGTGYVGSFDRGFMAEARVPSIPTVLEQVVARGCRQCLAGAFGKGDSCRYCGGELWSTPRLHWHPTDYGRALVAEHPLLARVLPVDREPDCTYAEDAPADLVYAWWREGNGPASAQLPHILFDRVIDRHKAFIVARSLITTDEFPTIPDAIDALGTALCDVLRETAG